MPSVRRAAAKLVLSAVPIALVGTLGAGCTQPDEPYKAIPAYSGRKAALPAVPTLPSKPIKQGDSYTVYGAQHHLRSRVHAPDVANKDISIIGYIVKTNLPDAPECAVHKTGKGDKDDCKAPIPAFCIADEKGDEKNAIKVMGWASNFANIFDAVEKYEKKDNKDVVKDEFWSVELPNPLPNVSAKVIVSGNYGVGFSKATTGMETDPLRGLITYAKMTYVEPPAEPGRLPFMKKKAGG